MKTTTNIFIGLMLAGVLIISSCTKPTVNPGGGSSGQLKSMIQITNAGGQVDSNTNTFTYDNQNRVVTQITTTSINGTGYGNDTTTYTYNATTVVQYTSNTHTSITYTLNGMGFRQSDNLGDTWTYNSAGYMIQSTTPSSSRITTYAYNNLNQLVTQVAASPSDTTTYTYTYSSNPIGTAGSSWSMGKSTGDQFTTDVETENGHVITLTATYVTNAQNQLIQSTVTSSTSPTTPTITYFIYY